jgi:spore coat polysaccharide biosynthesis protein SpsF
MLDTVSGVRPKISLFIQARMSSTRLPGKVLLPLGEKPLIQHSIERLSLVQRANHTALLIPNGPNDDILANYATDHLQVDLFRDSEEDVLSRFYHAAQAFHSNIIVRITADCPFIDAKLVDAAIDLFLSIKNCSYASIKNFPRGFDVEVFSFEALKEAFEKAEDPAEREHVTLYIYRHPEIFPLAFLRCPYDLSSLRLTVDEPDDLLTVRTIYEKVKEKPTFGFKEIFDLSIKQPELFLFNSHVKQKPVFLSEMAQEGIKKAPHVVYRL